MNTLDQILTGFSQVYGLNADQIKALRGELVPMICFWLSSGTDTASLFPVGSALSSVNTNMLWLSLHEMDAMTGAFYIDQMFRDGPELRFVVETFDTRTDAL